MPSLRPSTSASSSPSATDITTPSRYPSKPLLSEESSSSSASHKQVLEGRGSAHGAKSVCEDWGKIDGRAGGNASDQGAQSAQMPRRQIDDDLGNASGDNAEP
ncbi:hypothetical protein EDB92DRAFT_1821234 [Lactarius akahatsu]|uniref:Uncharacterized protein n=1 Tax=Lactarius akahatsu TaxID=416441 RepID=A0AAD4L5H5_9AGAM|nr:hypothetical protein EDB92DRAFT_1821234 [Lactarius akahatsu]